MHAAYGRIEVLRGVDLVVPVGSVFALLGPNGGGKTTTLNVVNGRLAPTKGCVHIGGVHVNGASTARLARAGVCSVPEGRGIFPNLTVDENLLLATYYTEQRSAADIRERAFARFPRLGERRAQVAGTLSWAIGCLVQANRHLSGATRSVELAAIGRRVAEQEHDLLRMLHAEVPTSADGTESAGR